MDTERRKALGKRIQRARRAAGYRSQKAFARDLGVHERSVAGAETGEVRTGLAVFTAIETAFGWPPESIARYLETGDLAELGEVTASTAPAAEPEPGRIDVSTLIRQLLDGNPEPPDIGHLDIRDDFEAEMIGLEAIPLLQRLTLIQIRRTRARGSSAGDTRPQRTA